MAAGDVVTSGRAGVSMPVAAGDVVHVRCCPTGRGAAGSESRSGRHRVVRPRTARRCGPDDLEARLLGEPATMGRRDVCRGAEVSLLSARKFWHALGFPNVEDEDAMFTEADLMALSGRRAAGARAGARRGRRPWR